LISSAKSLISFESFDYPYVFKMKTFAYLISLLGIEDGHGD